MNYLKQFNIRNWTDDINAYWRYKNLLSKFPNASEEFKETIKKHLDRLQIKWPNHKME